MTIRRYNPLIHCEKLKLSGLDENVANVIAMQQQEIIEDINANEISTKNDVQNILKSINELKNEIKGMSLKIESLEYKILIKLGSLMITLIGILGFLLKH